MELYINGIGCISPQVTSDNTAFLEDVRQYNSNRMLCVDADYSKFLDAGSIRRMSRLAKFGTTAGLLALKDAAVNTPGAISTGTGYGLLENSEKFLKSMIEGEESVLSPTAFIQSTHNTISSAIALITGCNAHNNTFSQKGVSFESALMDARLIMSQEDFDNVLVGSYDELSEKTFAIMERLHVFRSEALNNLELFKHPADNIIAGEGAAFFLLSKQKGENAYGKLVDSSFFYKPESLKEIKEKITAFLSANTLSLSDIDVVISGLNGEKKHDASLLELNSTFFNESTIVGFKHLCGEYMTASSFAFWLAAQILKTQTVPAAVVLNDKNRKPVNVLLYNVYNHNHSLILFKAC